jgi:hypothetical protein
MVNAKSLANLHPYKKGENNQIRKLKDGKKPPERITDLLRTMLDDPCPQMPGKTYRQAIAITMLNKCVEGDGRFTSDLLDRLEGKPTQPIGGEGGGPVLIEVIYDGSNKVQSTPAQPSS